jgi:hypothetical protein
VPQALPGSAWQAARFCPPEPGSGDGPDSGTPARRGREGGEELVAPGRVAQDVSCQLLNPADELGVELG